MGEQNKQEKGKEKGRETRQQAPRSFYDSTMPAQIHCRQCRTLMENGICPNCGYKMYVPMDPQKRDKIRMILTGVLIAAFVVIFVAMEIAKS